MSFAFDTGAGQHKANPASEGLREAWTDAIIDGLPDGHSQEQFYAAVADQIINDMWAKKSAVGVRRAFWNRIDHIRTMGNVHVREHDRVVSEFAERLSMLAGSPEESGKAHDAQKPSKTSNEETYNGF